MDAEEVFGFVWYWDRQQRGAKNYVFRVRVGFKESTDGG
jgi:hypothetical protein